MKDVFSPPIIAVDPLLNIPSPCKSYLSSRPSYLQYDILNESFWHIKAKQLHFYYITHGCNKLP